MNLPHSFQGELEVDTASCVPWIVQAWIEKRLAKNMNALELDLRKIALNHAQVIYTLDIGD
jgi:hypothetical protein